MISPNSFKGLPCCLPLPLIAMVTHQQEERTESSLAQEPAPLLKNVCHRTLKKLVGTMEQRESFTCLSLPSQCWRGKDRTMDPQLPFLFFFRLVLSECICYLSCCHQSKLRKGGFILTHCLRAEFTMAGKSWQARA